MMNLFKILNCQLEIFFSLAKLRLCQLHYSTKPLVSQPHSMLTIHLLVIIKGFFKLLLDFDNLHRADRPVFVRLYVQAYGINSRNIAQEYLRYVLFLNIVIQAVYLLSEHIVPLYHHVVLQQE
jgi:hypothetical protein